MFYIEGTRSRTGELGEPKAGILNELQSYLQATGRRAHFVPVSLSYSIVPEDVEIEAARQGKDISKKDLVAQLVSLDRGFGEHQDAPIHLRFGKPMTVDGDMKPKEFAEALIGQIRDGIVPSCTSLLATGIETACHDSKQQQFDAEKVRKQLLELYSDAATLDSYDTALEIFRNKSFIEPLEESGHYRVTDSDLIHQYANRLR
jgi:hypothetical protein